MEVSLEIQQKYEVKDFVRPSQQILLPRMRVKITMINSANN